MSVSRRTFLQGSAAVGGGILVTTYGCSSSPADRWGGEKDLVPSAQLRITPDNRVVVTVARTEMGQGTYTLEPMIIAEELGIDPTAIDIEMASNHADFAEPKYGVQVTGGSSSTKGSYEPLSRAGAMAREALLSAAAIEFSVPREELSIVGKKVLGGGKEASFGSLAPRARAHLEDTVDPKPKSEWRVLGRNQVRLDGQKKVDGTAQFGADYTPEGTEIAVIVRGPLGSTVKSFDPAAAQAVAGVTGVVEVPNGVAVLATRYYQARKAANLLQIDWTPSDFSTDAMFARFRDALDKRLGAGNARSDGDVAGALESADEIVEADYELPFLSHATMEPQNCTAWVKDDGTCEIWAPTQAPMQAAYAAADAAGVGRSKVKVHQTFLGGGFGRRSETDTVTEATYLSKLRRKPVRVQLSREDDMQTDFYRPASVHRLRGAIKGGKVVGWEHWMVQQSPMARAVPNFLGEVMPGFLAGAATWGMLSTGNDGSIVEGADKLPYALENISVGYHTAEEPVPVGFWRSVGHSSNAFVVETFFDELLAKAKLDPVEARRTLLKEHPRHLGVLETVARAARWGTPVAEGRGRGIAVHESFDSYVAVVAEVSVEGSEIRVHKLTGAVDCGLALNPDAVRAQIMGGMVFALSPALTQQAITYKDGRVQQSNFHDFQSLRMSASPEVEVHIVDSTEAPTGVGEPGVPPTAAAVANAVAALTGKRLRKMPFDLA